MQTTNRLQPGIVRDEALQAKEFTHLLSMFDAAGLRGAFVFTFIAPSYPTHATDASLDLDAASYALLRTWPDGRIEPKAAFHAVADHFAVQKAA